jgi:uncharacterized OB-fold protein
VSETPLEISRGEPRLIGGRCPNCGRVLFPYRERCPSCASQGVESFPLPEQGTLWSYTVQGFRPPSPPFADDGSEEFEPFGVGYVELPGALRVESRLLADLNELRIGMPLRLVPLQVAGEQLFAFAPVDDGEGPR